jgi:hypothetical protein
VNIGQIRTAVAAYLDVAVSDLTVGTLDMLLLAANHARRAAELRHNFGYTLGTFIGTVTPTEGLLLDSVPDVVTGAPASIRSISSVYERTGEGDIPIELQTSKNINQRYLERFRYEYITEWERYARAGGRLYTPLTTAYQEGNRLFVNPQRDENVVLLLVAHRWMPDYEGDLNEDFFLTYGSAYMMWSCIYDLNHRIMSFIQQKEGNLPPPSDTMEREFENLVMWDRAHLHGNRIVRLRP